MALVTLAACSLGFGGLRLPPNAVVGETRTPLAGVQMQLPNIGDMGSKFMNQMGLGDNAGLSKEESEAMEARLKSGDMSFDDFLKQVKVGLRDAPVGVCHLL